MRKGRSPAVEQRLKLRVIEARGERCEVCGWSPPSWRHQPGAMLEMHHMKPVALGGPHSPDNVVILCPNHHALAHEAFGRAPRKKPGDWRSPAERAAFLALLKTIDLDPEAWHHNEAIRVANLLAQE